MIIQTPFFDWNIFCMLKRIQKIWHCFDVIPDEIIYYIMDILSKTIHPNNLCLCTDEKCQLSWNKLLESKLYNDRGYHHCKDCHRDLVRTKMPICTRCIKYGCHICFRIYHNKKYICNTCWTEDKPKKKRIIMKSR